MEGYRLEFCLPGLPPTTNASGRKHWAIKVKEVNHWHSLVFAHLHRKVPKTPFKQLKLTLTRFSSVEPDYDGLVSSFKPIIDALVKGGVLEDDRLSNTGVPTYHWVKVKPKEGKVHILVELPLALKERDEKNNESESA